METHLNEIRGQKVPTKGDLLFPTHPFNHDGHPNIDYVENEEAVKAFQERSWELNDQAKKQQGDDAMDTESKRFDIYRFMESALPKELKELAVELLLNERHKQNERRLMFNRIYQKLRAEMFQPAMLERIAIKMAKQMNKNNLNTRVLKSKPKPKGKGKGKGKGMGKGKGKQAPKLKANGTPNASPADTASLIYNEKKCLRQVAEGLKDIAKEAPRNVGQAITAQTTYGYYTYLTSW